MASLFVNILATSIDLNEYSIYTYIAQLCLFIKEYINNWTFDVHSKVCGEITYFLPSLYAPQWLAMLVHW